jgi:hypothetical protein
LTPTNEDTGNLTDLADGLLAGPEWDAWVAAHPAEAAELVIARRVRALLAELQAEAIAVPPDFEARLLARLRADATFLDLLDLGLAGLGRTFLELLALVIGLLPAPQPQPSL